MAWHLCFTTYGTWLHGDMRGSSDEDGYIPPDPLLEESRKNQMAQKEFLLSDDMRQVVEKTIDEVCEYRKWKLFALNVRTNHVHVVIGRAEDRTAIIRDLKAYSTRRLREAGLIESDRIVWTKRCGHRELFDDEYLQKAIHYVLNCQ